MCNSEMQTIMEIYINLLDVVHFFVPVVLILLCSIDIFKIVVSKKEEDAKKLRNGVFKKIFYAIIIYALPFLIPFVFNMVSKILPMDYDNTWKNCYDFVQESQQK